jgi:hypothetical protein
MQTIFEKLIRDTAAVGMSAAMLGMEIGTKLLRPNFLNGRDPVAPHGPAASPHLTSGTVHPAYMPAREPTQDEIERRAYERWEQAGRPHGWDKEFYRMAERELRHQKGPIHCECQPMENEYPKENTPRTPVSPVEDTRELNDKPNFKKTDEPWKKPTEDSQDGPEPDLEKEQQLKTG